MKATVRILGFAVACLAALAACGDNIPRKSNAKEITAFTFTKAANPSLAADVKGTINGSGIALTVPFGTNPTALIASFDTKALSVSVNGVEQTSGTTANDFSKIVNYHVAAADGSSREYYVTVTVAPSTAKQLTAFAFTMAKNPALSADVTATINGTAIAATVPFGTNVTALIATYTTTGASVKVGTTTQTSGTTPNNFTSPVAYIVTAADGSTQTYTVTVTIAPSPAKAITAYSFLSANNAGLAADVTATIDETNHTIAATVPFGTAVTALVATFSTTGASVKVGGTAQVSGTTANDFTAAVTYTVTAANATTQNYVVTVTVAANPAKAITAFSFTSVNNAGLPADVTGTINEANHTIAATVPFGTNVTALIATFQTTGATVKVGNALQTSGMTANDFTAPVTYTVTAADATTQDYVVTVTIAANPAKAITAFSFTAAANTGNLAADATGTIDQATHTIAVSVPTGTTLTALVATFTITGASVSVGGTDQTSGTTPNDFTAAVTYKVKAADNTTQDYVVTVTVN